LVAVIAGTSFLVNSVQPVRRRTTTTFGQTTFKTHTLGQGGIQPGEIQVRTITPVHFAATDQVSGFTPTPAPLPKAKKTTAPTVAPSAAPTAGTVVDPPPTVPLVPPPSGTAPCNALLGLGCPRAPAAP